eukprot:6803343-Prymnesium_polylepis.1
MSMRAGKRVVVQAAAGGVGIKAIEYAHWVRAEVIGTAGALYKHTQLHGLKPEWLCSSRNGTAFAQGAT